MVIFYYDFPPPCKRVISDPIPAEFTVDRKNAQDEMNQADLGRILNFWNPEIARRSMSERFEAGASLWLIRHEGQLAGYGWTLTGGTMRGYFVPLGTEDVHLFDFLVFPEFRGRRVNPTLVRCILEALGHEAKSRAYIEVAEWNEPELKSLRRTSFQLLGMARKANFSSRTIVEWRAEQDGQG
jgi:ribosomal protein S18 acetylase RimI-like enzyme